MSDELVVRLLIKRGHKKDQVELFLTVTIPLRS
jgi:hypothetical protein